jgi:uncharacterized integral membrane protein (TIGR00697 family)
MMLKQSGISQYPPIDPAVLHRRRENVFLVLAGLFLGTLAMLNILGISRFIKLVSFTMAEGTPDQWELVFAVAVGVLPYPVTFLCTDLISEFFGRKRANAVVIVGLILNIWVVAILWLGGVMPGWEQFDADGQMVRDAAGRLPVFFEVRALTFGAVGASMIAYFAAQFCDVQVFHFWKRLTKGKHLWLRNNASTLVSQMIDTVAVILITYYFTENGLRMVDTQPVWFQLLVSFILAGYIFKLLAALLDTPLIYLAVYLLKDYLQIDPTVEHAADSEVVQLNSDASH